MFRKRKIDREFMLDRIGNCMCYYEQKAEEYRCLASVEECSTLRHHYLKLYLEYYKCYLNMSTIYWELGRMV